MRVMFVTGSRRWTDTVKIKMAMDACDPELVIEGEANGADRLSAAEARSRGIEVEGYPAEWARYRKSAGPIRNRKMLARLVELREAGHEVIPVAFHEDLTQSRGTADMVKLLKGAGFGCMFVQ